MRRTTVTLDPDVDQLLQRMMRERDLSFEKPLNEAIRLGVGSSHQQLAKPFQQKTYRMGFRPEFQWDKALLFGLAEAMEDEELVRKLERRKRRSSMRTCCSMGSTKTHHGTIKRGRGARQCSPARKPSAFRGTSYWPFLRLSTRPVVFDRPPQPVEAINLIDEWLRRPCAIVGHPGEHHLRVLRDLLAPLGTGGNWTSDAHLAALAIEHGAELCSCDPEFSGFAGLRWRNPVLP